MKSLSALQSRMKEQNAILSTTQQQLLTQQQRIAQLTHSLHFVPKAKSAAEEQHALLRDGVRRARDVSSRQLMLRDQVAQIFPPPSDLSASPTQILQQGQQQGQPPSNLKLVISPWRKEGKARRISQDQTQPGNQLEGTTPGQLSTSSLSSPSAATGGVETEEEETESASLPTSVSALSSSVGVGSASSVPPAGPSSPSSPSEAAPAPFGIQTTRENYVCYRFVSCPLTILLSSFSFFSFSFVFPPVSSPFRSSSSFRCSLCSCFVLVS